MAKGSPAKKTKAIGGIAIVGLIIALWLLFGDSAQEDSSVIKIAVTPYPDTTLMLYGIEKGFFRDQGIDLQVRDATWAEQIEFLAGGGCDLAMSTMDEFVGKAKNLQKFDRRCAYLTPTWIFEGRIFVCRKDMKSLDELRESVGTEKAPTAFLDQLKGKKLAVPEGSHYEHGLRKFIEDAGDDPGNYNFVNTRVEVGINGLEDPDVGLAAAGIVQRLEALRRGHKIALNPEDFGSIVLTGFIVKYDYYAKNSELLDSFLKAWFKTTDAALNDLDNYYVLVKEYLDGRGASVPTSIDFMTALKFQRIARTNKDAWDMFFDPNSPTNWKIAWDMAIENLKETGKGDDTPDNYNDFIGNEFITKP